MALGLLGLPPLRALLLRALLLRALLLRALLLRAGVAQRIQGAT